MTEKSDSFGRTFFDFISEHPKMTFTVFLALLFGAIGIFCFVLYKGNSVKIAGLKVEPHSSLVPDTIVKIEKETIFIEKPRTNTDHIEAKNSLPVTKIKSDDTQIDVKNQPTNINTGNNNGIIGNDNTIEIDVKEVKRSLNVDYKRRLVKILEEAFEINENIKDSCILVSTFPGAEPFIFAEEILAFVQSKGMNATGITQYAARYPPVKGVEIGFMDNCVEILVGYE